MVLFTGPAPVVWWKLFPGNFMAFTPCFLSFFPTPPLEKCNRTILWGGETLVPRREEKGLCVWSISDHAGQIHQHVRGIGWVEKYEVQREERPFSLQTVSGKESRTGFLPPAHRPPTRWQQLLFFFLKAFSSKVVLVWDRLTWNWGMHWLQIGRWENLFSLCSSSSKVLLPFNAKLSHTSVLVYSKCNEYTLLSKAFLSKFEGKLVCWWLVLLLFYLFCSGFGIHFQHL